MAQSNTLGKRRAQRKAWVEADARAQELMKKHPNVRVEADPFGIVGTVERSIGLIFRCSICQDEISRTHDLTVEPTPHSAFECILVLAQRIRDLEGRLDNHNF